MEDSVLRSTLREIAVRARACACSCVYACVCACGAAAACTGRAARGRRLESSRLLGCGGRAQKVKDVEALAAKLRRRKTTLRDLLTG